MMSGREKLPSESVWSRRKRSCCQNASYGVSLFRCARRNDFVTPGGKIVKRDPAVSTDLVECGNLASFILQAKCKLRRSRLAVRQLDR